MSIEFGLNGTDSSNVHEAGFKTAHVLMVEGQRTDVAHVIGEHAGTIGSTLTLLALRKMGLIDYVDPHGFNDALASIEREVGVRDELEKIWAADSPTPDLELTEEIK